MKFVFSFKMSRTSFSPAWFSVLVTRHKDKNVWLLFFLIECKILISYMLFLSAKILRMELGLYVKIGSKDGLCSNFQIITNHRGQGIHI